VNCSPSVNKLKSRHLVWKQLKGSYSTPAPIENPRCVKDRRGLSHAQITKAYPEILIVIALIEECGVPHWRIAKLRTVLRTKELLKVKE
jgi:hypothetical protein